MCKRKEIDDKDRGHNKLLLDFIDSLVRRSITTHNIRSPRNIWIKLQLQLLPQHLWINANFWTPNHHFNFLILYVLVDREKITISSSTWYRSVVYTVYCQYLYMEAKATAATALQKICKPSKTCSIFLLLYLCDNHFNLFHKIWLFKETIELKLGTTQYVFHSRWR